MQNTIFFLLLLVPLMLTSCQRKEKTLFQIVAPEGMENDLLFMVESTNVLPIKRDSLIYFLTKEELLSADKLLFKDFGKIYENEQFEVRILLKEGSKSGRDYTFIARTYTKDFKPIDSFEFAHWVKASELFCFGSIDQSLIIRRTCSDEEEVVRIGENGQILKKLQP